MTIFLGIDIGSTTVKVVVVDETKTMLAQRYLRSEGRPRQTLLRAVQSLHQEVDLSEITGVGMTGSGGEQIANLIGGHHVNELIAQTRAIGEYYPQARTVIEIGGQDSKFLSTQWDEKSGKMLLVDFAMNTLCAAGTGSFLDQQAERLNISIEEEFGELALQAEKPARIAGRCTVFAKSDMIHLQQKGTPLPDIIAGLCLALARNFKSVIGKGKAFTPPVLFQGGVAYNQGVVRAFETVLGLQPGELIIPTSHPLMAALGTAFAAMDQHNEGTPLDFQGFDQLEVALQSNAQDRKTMPSLTRSGFPMPAYNATPTLSTTSTNGNGTHPGRLPSYLGIDVGSISTNVVLIDEHAHVIARRYLQTRGKPLEAVRHALHEIGEEVGQYVEVRGVGTTGSGRHLTADFVGGDVIRNEITAQARAATAIDPRVDTIFEIGGQDSKYISLDHGAIVDFAMNSACAAGTGSFLEEQADRLKINIKEDFSNLALSSCCPTGLGERCTVFMESDIIHHQQQGAQVEQLTAGLAYAIAQNYLNRVVDGRRIGEHIFFQGGVAWNRGVVAAFQELLNRPIIVPPHHDVTGAIGAAILGMEEIESRRAEGEAVQTNFKGFDLGAVHYQTTSFECQACPNLCEVSKVSISGHIPIFYGARCDKFEEAGRHSGAKHMAEIPDLFAERSKLLLGDYVDPPEGGRNGRMRVAIPRAMIFHDLFPYWRTFFNALDIEIVLSAPTNATIVRMALEHAGVETCFPAKLVYGHVMDLVGKGADFVFLPGLINRENVAPGQTENNYCPYIPASSYLVSANIDLEAHGLRPLRFPLKMRFDHIKKKDLAEFSRQLGISARRISDADRKATQAQKAFYAAVRRRGREVLDQLDDEHPAAVIVGRPYNTTDLGVCQDLPYKLRKLGILPIPMDFLPVDEIDITEHHASMFWRSGQDILAAAHIIRDTPRLHAIYVTNFSCGPDSFIISFFRRIMGVKPYLELEMDEHTADAGIITRCEAFFDSLKMGKGVLV